MKETSDVKSDPIMEGGKRGKEREIRGWEISSGGMMGRMRRKKRQGSKNLIRHVACLQMFAHVCKSKASRTEMRRHTCATCRHVKVTKWTSHILHTCTQTLSFLSWSSSALAASPSLLLPPPQSYRYICMNEDWDCCEIKRMTCDRPWDWCCGDAVCTCMCCFCSRYGKYIPLLWS